MRQAIKMQRIQHLNHNAILMGEAKKFLDELDNKRKEVLSHFDEWNELYPDFKRISEIMEDFKTNDLLVEYQKNSLPSFIKDKAIEIYKKCLSFKVKLKKYKLDKLGYSYTPKPYCISNEKVQLFVNEYQIWGRKSYEVWHNVYYLKEDFFHNRGYKFKWDFSVRHNMLKYDLQKIETIYNETIEFLQSGIELINKYDEMITLEYETKSFEMSLFEREREIEELQENYLGYDEEYCFVYTLECDVFVFYVGIAFNPSERFEQHLRGAFSDESHLFKSKFIQKYHMQVRQKIVYEGTRRDCKKFEREYISEHNPLGNMTEGGEG